MSWTEQSIIHGEDCGARDEANTRRSHGAKAFKKQKAARKLASKNRKTNRTK